MAETTESTAPLVFDWHAENVIDRDSLLVWLIPTAMRRTDMETLSGLTDRFTRCELRITLNGVDLDARAFLEGVARSIERAARDESASLAETAGFGDIEDAVSLMRDAVRAEMLGRLRAAGVPIREEED